MGRTPCCDRAAVKRGPWSPEEDDALRSYVQRYGSGGNWIAMPKKAGELADRSYLAICRVCIVPW